MTRLTALAFMEWLVNCPVRRRVVRRSDDIHREPLADCLLFGGAYAKVDPVPLMRQPIWVERLREVI